MIKVDKRRYDQDRYEKLYDFIELIYILNKLSNKTYVDDRSKQHLIGMLNNVESIKYNFDKYRDKDTYERNYKVSSSKYEPVNSNDFLEKIFFFLKSLNN